MRRKHPIKFPQKLTVRHDTWGAFSFLAGREVILVGVNPSAKGITAHCYYESDTVVNVFLPLFLLQSPNGENFLEMHEAHLYCKEQRIPIPKKYLQ